jgi:hypothetical protein
MKISRLLPVVFVNVLMAVPAFATDAPISLCGGDSAEKADKAEKTDKSEATVKAEKKKSDKKEDQAKKADSKGSV